MMHTANQAQQQNNNTFRSIFTEDQQRTADILILVPNHLTLTVFQYGLGLHPQIGQFIRYKQISYLEKQMQFLKQQIIEVPFQRGKLIPALQIALSFAKQNSRFRLWTSSILAYHGNFHPDIPMDSNLVFDLHVYSISKIPTQLSGNQDLLNFFQEILTQSKQGDEHLKNGRFEQSLSSYQNAVNQLLRCNLKEKIMSIFHMGSQPQQGHQKQAKLPIINSSILVDQQKIVQKFQNTCFKYLELCYSIGEYLKVVTMTQKIKKFLNNDSHHRILNVLIKTYLQLQELELAQKHLERMKSLKEANKQTIDQLEKEVQKFRTSDQHQKIN